MFQNNTLLQKLNINTDKSTILCYSTKFGEKQSVQSHPLFTLHLCYHRNASLQNLGTNFSVLIKESISPCEVNKEISIFKLS
jgi:hypothetical protein